MWLSHLPPPLLWLTFDLTDRFDSVWPVAKSFAVDIWTDATMVVRLCMCVLLERRGKVKCKKKNYQFELSEMAKYFCLEMETHNTFMASSYRCAKCEQCQLINSTQHKKKTNRTTIMLLSCRITFCVSTMGLVTPYIDWFYLVFLVGQKNLPAVSWHMNRAGLNSIFTCFGVHTYLVLVVDVAVVNASLCAANFCALSTTLPNESPQNNTDTIRVIFSLSLSAQIWTHICAHVFTVLFFATSFPVLSSVRFGWGFSSIFLRFLYSIRFSIGQYNDHINQMCRARLFWQLAASQVIVHCMLKCCYARTLRTVRRK